MSKGQIPGQMSIFDFIDRPAKRRPCDYRFHRYLGQKVYLRGREGVFRVRAIFQYYTHVVDGHGEPWIGTPYDIWPVNEKEVAKDDG